MKETSVRIEQGQESRCVDRMNRVGKPDVGETCGREYFGLAKLGAANPDRSTIDLPARHHRALVGLGVRPQANAAAVGRILHPIDVAQRPLAVDDHRGRRQIVQGHIVMMSCVWPGLKPGPSRPTTLESDCGRRRLDAVAREHFPRQLLARRPGGA